MPPQSNRTEVGSRLLGGDTVYIYHTEVEALLSNGQFCLMLLGF